MTGRLVQTGFVTLCVLLAWRPPRPRRSAPWRLSYGLTFLVNEQPLWGLVWLLSVGLPVLTSATRWGPLWLTAAVLTAAATVGLAVLGLRARTARPTLALALQHELALPDAKQAHTPVQWLRVLVLPFVSYRPGVRRLRNLRYGPGGRGNLLDLYQDRRAPQAPTPLIVYIHGGAFRFGSKRLGGRPLLYHLARRGWTCASISYRPRTNYDGQLADVKKAIAWLRARAADLSIDTTTVVIVGSSAGAHLAATAALTASDPEYQRGFESADTSVDAMIGLYGYYGPAGGSGRTSSAAAAVSAAAPPMLLIHGAIDTLVLPAEARSFAQTARTTGNAPVVYAELPGTQHGFDLFNSVRLHAVLDAIDTFTTWVRDTQSDRTPWASGASSTISGSRPETAKVHGLHGRMRPRRSDPARAFSTQWPEGRGPGARLGG
ncbi:alpha/beta hydrolase fold domain-containing protein [Knoellia koreensis]|uniref:Alpha/beta hydrolase n=1 Tax=Knoellia koreensis TaxID=2730921 RepID=A0A849HD04_9MICO|nr:alpha/beta hydrolase [Knoellia sp. DB2414S]